MVMIHDVQAHMLPNECGDSGHDCRCSTRITVVP
eukprot:COSAG05_NODE_27801_length_143_cov_12.568182_1_plen_33_part_10